MLIFIITKIMLKINKIYYLQINILKNFYLLLLFNYNFYIAHNKNEFVLCTENKTIETCEALSKDDLEFLDDLDFSDISQKNNDPTSSKEKFYQNKQSIDVTPEHEAFLNKLMEEARK